MARVKVIRSKPVKAGQTAHGFVMNHLQGVQHMQGISKQQTAPIHHLAKISVSHTVPGGGTLHIGRGKLRGPVKLRKISKADRRSRDALGYLSTQSKPKPFPHPNRSRSV